MDAFKEGMFIGLIFGAIVVSVFFFSLFNPVNVYKNGQIDAINGIIKYEIKCDSTWVEKVK